jgi:hypothetical protein
LWSKEHDRKIDAMIDHAIDTCKDLLGPLVPYALISRLAREARDLRTYLREMEVHRSPWMRNGFALGRVVRGSAAARQHLKRRLLRQPISDWLIERLQVACAVPMIVQPFAPPGGTLDAIEGSMPDTPMEEVHDY